MKRFDRKKYAERFFNKSLRLKSAILSLDVKDKSYTEKRNELEKELEINRAKIKRIFDNSVYLLIATTDITSKDDKPLYENFYYLADIDKLKNSYTSNPDELKENVIDLRTFFNKIGIPTDKEIDTSITIWFAIEIIKSIIENLFATHEYHSWEEVKKDLLKLEDMYERPQYRETEDRYKERVLKR